MTDLIEFRRQQRIKKRLKDLTEQLDKQSADIRQLKAHSHDEFATKKELTTAKAEISKPYVHPRKGVCPQKPRVHKHLPKHIVGLKIPEKYDYEQLKKDHPKLKEPYLHSPKKHLHPAKDITDKIKPEQIQRKGLDADTVDGKHAKELLKRVVYMGGGGAGGEAGPHAATHETGGADKVHLADLEHDEGDSTLHDSLTSTPHLSQAEKDKLHDRQHDHSLAADGSPIAVTGVPDLPASKITSERFPLARLPDGALDYVIKGAGAGVDPVYGQVDHGALSGLGDDDHIQYLLVDGSRAMAGNLDLAGNRLRTTNLDFYELDANTFVIQQRGTGVDRALKVENLYVDSSVEALTVKPRTSLLNISHDSGEEVHFKSNDGLSLITVGKLKNGQFQVDALQEMTADNGITIDGILLKDNAINVDIINEKTVDTGVTADGVLLKDGGLKTTGDIQIDQGTVGFRFTKAANYVLALYNLALSDLQGLRCYNIQTSVGFRTISELYKMYFKVHDNTGSVQTVATGVSNVPTPYFEINQAGDINMLADKVLNSLNGVFRLPNSAPASPSTNDCYFDPATNKLYVYNGTSWVSTTLT